MKVAATGLHAAHVQSLLDSLPDTPGVYQFFDAKGEILYVGKAKNLRHRVLSYFRDSVQSAKTRALVKRISDIKVIHVTTEQEALLLENNLIKQFRPHYNILLKDDKSYPYITITQEPFPRLYQTHRKQANGNQYFGPYPSGKTIRALMRLIGDLFPYRTCKLPLNEKNIKQHHYKACINHQIKRCNAPCQALETQEEYQQTIEKIKQILRGHFSEIMHGLKKEMMQYAHHLEFEKAHHLKSKIQLLEHYQSQWTVVSHRIKNAEVYNYYADESRFYVNRLHVLEGAVVHAYSTEVVGRLDELPQEILAAAILRLRDLFDSTIRHIIVPHNIDLPEEYLLQTVPKTGDGKRLLDLSLHNATFYRLEKKKRETLLDPQRHSHRLLEALQKDLHLSQLPRHIECFDNSNTQGTHPVAAMVCFMEGKPAKKNYRHFLIKTVEGANDFASMQEIILRRYRRLLHDNAPLPQLIVVDGGKGQISAAQETLQQLDLYPRIALIGIAERLEEIYFPNNPYPLYLDKNSESLKLLQRLRNEAHRFAITHHRQRRSNQTIKTSLTDIKGIGETTARNLLLKFSSLKQIQNASMVELTACIGAAKAKLVWQALHD